ncbi:hypothetical protein AB1286_24835 [Trinickia sp. NRRL B-1857]|uniref:NACHT domain-containing protein n=1 Tax=Trinickia sp. NRRL B-1857 TaxID=3162879 RepID=UPI003D29094F
MTGKQSKRKAPKATDAKKTGGGTAVGGGVNFQAAVTAIVGVHILRGTALTWLDGICSDKPIAVWAESEGPGDDLCIEFETSAKIEVQVKKGLVRGTGLWEALRSIAKAIHQGRLSHGVLVVASDSSNTVREDLAKDIERLGQGRTDSLTEIGEEWARRLRDANIPAQTVCRCMRIRVIYALSPADPDIGAAKEVLRSICARNDDIDEAWNGLYYKAVLAIANRGRWTLYELIRLLKGSNIAIREDEFPASVIDRYSRWVRDAHAHFSITGIKRKIPLSHLLPMQLEETASHGTSAGDAALALERYHKREERARFDRALDAAWTARFKRLAVVVAGPGLGKSTLIKELAYQYSQDGYPVLRVALKPIAAAMEQGATFTELLLSHALDGFPVSPEQVRGFARLNLVVLADGLDECGSAHGRVAEQINSFALGHPRARMVVTTRPIGYDTDKLSDWTHYRLLPPRKENGAKNLEKLVRAVSTDERGVSDAADSSSYRLGHTSPSEAISISPQLLGMSASLIYHLRALPDTRFELYGQLMSLFERAPADALEEADLYEMILDIIGWILMANPLITFNELVRRTAETLALAMEAAPLTLTRQVRRAIAHWERVGLIEKVFHGSTELLTFIHKTFCEFVAARYLVRNRKQLIGEVVDQPDKQEVVNFAVAQGLADDLIEFYLARHAEGRARQLEPGLSLLRDEDVAVSERWAQALIRQSLKAIEEGATERFGIGLALSKMVKKEKAGQLVGPWAAANLESSDPAIKLVAWAVAVSDRSAQYDADKLSAALAECLGSMEAVSLRDVVDRKDRRDRDLIEVVALAALKAQSDDRARLFAEQHLQHSKLATLKFRFQVNAILKSRGIEPLPLPPLSEMQTKPSAGLVRSVPSGPSWAQAYVSLYRTITRAFVGEQPEPTTELNRGRPFVQFAGLIYGSGFMERPANDIYAWTTAHDELAAQATIRAVAQLLPLDLGVLAEEARALMCRADEDLIDSIFDFYPAVDIGEPNWDNAKDVPLNREQVLRGLLHPSEWINYLAANIFVCLPMSRDELEALLNAATGDSLRRIVGLILHHYFDQTQAMLVQRLTNDASGDVSAVFDAFVDLQTSPSLDLMKATLTALGLSNANTVESASELLTLWVDSGTTVDEEVIAKAIEHWENEDGGKRNSLSKTPLDALDKLLERVRAAQ